MFFSQDERFSHLVSPQFISEHPQKINCERLHMPFLKTPECC